MPFEWGLNMLIAEWTALLSVPVLLGLAVVIGLAVGCAATWFVMRKTLTRQARRLADYQDDISRLQHRLSANGDSYRVHRSELRLLLHGKQQAPTAVFYMNVSQWCLLDQNFMRIDKEINRDDTSGPACLFLLFDLPTSAESLQIASDAGLPHYEVKEFNDRFAIIVFPEPIPAGTLEIRIG